MNFDNENRNGVPRVTGLPESQFRTPEAGSFMAENPKESTEPVFEEVKPFNPEEYTQVREVENNQSPTENIAEEREIVNYFSILSFCNFEPILDFSCFNYSVSYWNSNSSKIKPHSNHIL